MADTLEEIEARHARIMAKHPSDLRIVRAFGTLALLAAVAALVVGGQEPPPSPGEVCEECTAVKWVSYAAVVALASGAARALHHLARGGRAYQRSMRLLSRLSSRRREQG